MCVEAVYSTPNIAQHRLQTMLGGSKVADNPPIGAQVVDYAHHGVQYADSSATPYVSHHDASVVKRFLAQVNELTIQPVHVGCLQTLRRSMPSASSA